MNNTHKLLLAFIDASGYEVEGAAAIDEVGYQAASEVHRAMVEGMQAAGLPCYKQHPIMADYLTTDYKVTKKVTTRKCVICGGKGYTVAHKCASDCVMCDGSGEVENL